MPILFDLSKYKNEYFIETGTYNGEGIDKALETNSFKYIYSIEIDTLRHLICKERYGTYDNVTLIKGNSGELLKLVLKNINVPCTFWLDAHFCGDDAEYGTKWSPIVEELEAIKNHHIKNHTIIVDDYRCMDNMHFDKERKIPVGFPGKKKLLEILQSINPDYNISFLLGAEPGDAVLAKVEYGIICKNVLNEITTKIELDEKNNIQLPIIVDKLVNNVLIDSVKELKDEGRLISESIIYDLVLNIEEIIKNKEKMWLKNKQEELKIREDNLKNKEEKYQSITLNELNIIQEKMNKLDEKLTKKEHQLEIKDEELQNREYEVKIREETLKEIIIDLELQKDIQRYNLMEKKASRSTKRGSKKKRNERNTR